MPYWFRIPSLPKPIYDKIVDITKTHDVTQRSVIIAGVKALARLGQSDPAAAEALLKEPADSA